MKSTRYLRSMREDGTSTRRRRKSVEVHNRVPAG